jgi:hypothetical protein
VAYVRFSKHKNKPKRPPTVAFAKHGRIQLNQSAVQALGDDPANIKCVFLLWDKSANKVGIQPTRKKDKETYNINFNPGGGAALSAKSFFDFIGHSKQETTWFPARWIPEEKLLEVELKAISSLPEKEIAKKVVEYRDHRQVR